MMKIEREVAFAPEGPAGGGAAPSSGSGGSESSAPQASPASSPSGASPSSSPSEVSSGPTSSSTGNPIEVKPSGRKLDAAASNAGENSTSFGEDFFAGMNEVEIEPDSTLTPPAASEQTLSTSPSPTPAPTAEVPPTAPDQPQSPEQKPQAEAKKPDATQESPTPPVWQPDKLADLMRAQEGALESELMKEFALSAEDVEALETDAAGTIPKLLARTAVRTQANTMRYMAKAIPEMIARHLETFKSANENLDKFFSQWPTLDRHKHQDVVLETAKLYRQMNPQATPEQMMKEVGPLAMLRAGIPLTSIGTAQPGSKPGNGVRPPPAPPFVPAMGGSAAPPSSPEAHPWDGLYIQDD